MLRSSFVLACAALLAPVCLAQTKLEATDIANHPFSAHFAPESRLKLRVRSGEVHVIGADRDEISVELSGKKAYDAEARDLKVRLDRTQAGAHLRISGGPRNGVMITIHVPTKTDLHARVPFGDVHVENIAGNQNVELHAGQLIIDVGDSAAYSQVDASVMSGEVDAAAFGESHGGLFRSFRRQGSGRYRLHGHVGAGQLTLQ